MPNVAGVKTLDILVHLVPWSKNDPTTTLPLNKKLLFIYYYYFLIGKESSITLCTIS